MSRLTSRFFQTALIMVVILVSLPSVQAVTAYWQGALGTTNSWTDANNWRTNWNSTGDAYLPQFNDSVSLINGVCSIDGDSNIFIKDINNRYEAGSSYTLDIEEGSTLTVSNQFRLGNLKCDATVNIRGDVYVPVAINTGFVLGGYRAGLTNSTGILNIDGGSLRYGDSDYANFVVGGAATGRVEITNGGKFYNKRGTVVGSGADVQSDGTFILQDGSWTNIGSIQIGGNYNGDASDARVIINGGEFASMAVAGDYIFKVGVYGGNGYFEMNGGEFIGRHAFNDASGNANRSLIGVGYTSTSDTGLFIQNGGYIETVGIVLGKGLGTATAIISNGLFSAMCNNGSWPCFDIYTNSTLSIAGGDFLMYTNSGAGNIRDGGTLEFIDGSMDVCDLGATFYTYSNATIRIIGPKCDIDVGWWRDNSPYSGLGQLTTTMELILTQDPGHLSTFKSPRTGNNTALPGTLDVGFAGGACLLTTNTFVAMRAGRYLSTTYVDPANYGLNLWDSGRTGTYQNDELYITLKDSASVGTVSLPSVTYASFSPTSYGYVDVENLNVGSLPELTVIMTMAAGAKTLDAVVKDLQSAGYTNSVQVDSQTIAMKIPADMIVADDETFAWDFREFDGTVNATISAVAFNFNPRGSVFLIQ